MSIFDRNPFSDTRVETATGGQLLARHAAVRALESARNCLLMGSRGSGKTSALLCLGWEERANNISLIKELGSGKPEFISVYSKLHHHVSAAINKIPWETVVGSHAAEGTAYEYFSVLIELLASELLITAIVKMRADAIINYSFESEATTADAIRDIILSSGFDSSANILPDLSSCAAWCRDRRLLTHKRGARQMLTEVLDSLPSTRPGQFLQSVVGRLDALLRLPSSANALPSTFHFKICFDEAETLTPEQQRFLNTLVRRSTAPLFWIVSTVDRNFETTETVERGQSLTATDREIIDLDYHNHMAGFKAFAEQIASLRIKNALGCYASQEPTEYDDLQVRVDYLLDHFSINCAIDRLIQSSKSAFASQLRIWAEEFGREYKGDDGQLNRKAFPRERPRRPRQTPRFYEAYLIKKLFPQKTLREVMPAEKDHRINFFAALRRKQYGALLCIVREGRFSHVPYFGVESLLKLADGNIREFLEILQVMFAIVASKAEDPLLLFVSHSRRESIGWTTQRKAFSEASEIKLNGITNRHAEVGGSVSTLIQALGRLTYLLQSDIEGSGALRTAERGNFSIDLSELVSMHGFDRDGVIERTREVIDRCIEDSLLKEAGPLGSARPVSHSRTLYQVRVHQRFAPYFRTSLRGAYATQTIPARSIAEICVAPAGMNAVEWANSVFELLRSREIDVDQTAFDWTRPISEDSL
jgi:hypothetical protein